MRIRNLNPDTDIGASAWWLELDGHRLLMDAGVHPKLEGRASLPLLDLVKDTELDAIAITHCHHDHVGWPATSSRPSSFFSKRPIFSWACC
ncbi:MAG: MBL fold metallo-hydrolase, partial [Verrucomicrobia bacterium]|nr:MBL fold metallo-hydrolase [Verrucomicrobiota bacterium]